MHRAWSPLPLTAWPIQMDSSSVELDKTAEKCFVRFANILFPFGFTYIGYRRMVRVSELHIYQRSVIRVVLSLNIVFGKVDIMQ